MALLGQALKCASTVIQTNATCLFISNELQGSFFQSRLTENCSNHRHRLNQPCFTAKTYPEAMEEGLNSTETLHSEITTELLIFSVIGQETKQNRI